MITFSVKPIRLLLQIITADAFIGERDKTACGQAIALKAQGSCGRLQIITNTGNCVWRLAKGMVSAILELWSRITLVGLSSHGDSSLDYLAESITRCPQSGTETIRHIVSYPTFTQCGLESPGSVSWHIA